MSSESLSKQLPRNHIAEMRFFPYKKANKYIKHLNNAYMIGLNSDNYDNCNSFNKKFQQQVPQDNSKKRFLIPESKVSKELEEKIELVNIFNNISRIKAKKDKARTKSTLSFIGAKNIKKVKSNKYHEMLTKALLENTRIKLENLEDLKSFNQPRLSRYTLKRNTSRVMSKIYLEKDSTLASDRVETESKILTPVVSHFSSKEKSVNLPKIKRFTVQPKRINHIFQDCCSISPIVNLNKCVGL